MCNERLFTSNVSLITDDQVENEWIWLEKYLWSHPLTNREKEEYVKIIFHNFLFYNVEQIDDHPKEIMFDKNE